MTDHVLVEPVSIRFSRADEFLDSAGGTQQSVEVGGLA